MQQKSLAFEIDDRLVPILADTLRDFDNVAVVNQDILKGRPQPVTSQSLKSRPSDQGGG